MSTSAQTSSSGSTQSSYLLNIPSELLGTLLQLLDNGSLIRCCQVSSELNLLAIQTMLERHSIWKPTKHCSFKIDSTSKMAKDVLAALLFAVHIGTKFEHLHIDMSPISSHTFLAVPLARVVRLFQKLESVNLVSLRFSRAQARPWMGLKLTHEEQMDQVGRPLRDLLTAALQKGCVTLKLHKLPSHEWAEAYTFCPHEETRTSSVLKQVKGYAKKLVDRGHSKALEFEGDVQYKINNPVSVKRTYILPPPLHILESSKLTRFTTSSAVAFRPPFSTWTFSALAASKVKDLGITFNYLPDDDKECRYILNRLVAALPNLERISLEVPLNNDSQRISLPSLECAASFTKLQKLAVASSFPTNFDTEDFELTFPELWMLECSPSLLAVLLTKEDRVNLPKLTMINFRQDGLHLPLLAESIQKAKLFLDRREQGRPAKCVSALNLRFDTKQLAQIPTGRGQSQDVDPSTDFTVISSLDVRMPGTRGDIVLGVYDKYIVGLLTLFPNIVRLCVYTDPNDYFSPKSPSVAFSQTQIQMFQNCCPSLARRAIVLS